MGRNFATCSFSKKHGKPVEKCRRAENQTFSTPQLARLATCGALFKARLQGGRKSPNKGHTEAKIFSGRGWEAKTIFAFRNEANAALRH
jgi:hypothetical protein